MSAPLFKGYNHLQDGPDDRSLTVLVFPHQSSSAGGEEFEFDERDYRLYNISHFVDSMVCGEARLGITLDSGGWGCAFWTTVERVAYLRKDRR